MARPARGAHHIYLPSPGSHTSPQPFPRGWGRVRRGHKPRGEEEKSYEVRWFAAGRSTPPQGLSILKTRGAAFPSSWPLPAAGSVAK